MPEKILFVGSFVSDSFVLSVAIFRFTMKYCWHKALHRQDKLSPIKWHSVFSLQMCVDAEGLMTFIYIYYIIPSVCLFADIVDYMIYLSQDTLHDLNAGFCLICLSILFVQVTCYTKRKFCKIK